VSTIPCSQPPTPPREPGALSMESGPSSWPTVLGVIAIVLGGLGCLGGCWGALSPLFIRGVLKMVPQAQMPGPGLDQFKEWGPWITISSLIGVPLAVLLLASGIGLVQRRRWAVGVGRCWAILKMIWVVITSVASVVIQQGQFEALGQQNPMPGLSGGLFVVIGVFAAVLALVWGWALPVFFLIWFALKKTKREVAVWR